MPQISENSSPKYIAAFNSHFASRDSERPDVSTAAPMRAMGQWIFGVAFLPWVMEGELVRIGASWVAEKRHSWRRRESQRAGIRADYLLALRGCAEGAGVVVEGVFSFFSPFFLSFSFFHSFFPSLSFSLFLFLSFPSLNF